MLCTGKGRAVANTATAEVLVMLATDGTAPTDKRVELKITNGEAYASISQKGMLIIKKSGGQQDLHRGDPAGIILRNRRHHSQRNLSVVFSVLR